MIGLKRLFGTLGVGLLLLGAQACASYPSEPRYSTRPMPTAGQPVGPAYGPAYAPSVPPPPADPYAETGYAPGPVVTAPVGEVSGGELDAVEAEPLPPIVEPDPQPAPPMPPPPPASAAPAVAGVAYEVQAGDTLWGIGQRFQAPIQTLVDLNDLGPRAAIRPGMRLTLPEDAVDTGSTDRAAGPSPRGVRVPAGAAPPPPPPPSGNPAAPRPGVGGTVTLDWPIRGAILSRFGVTGVSERNSGIDIAGEAGAPVRASALGRVGYVGDMVAEQGLTVLIVHPDGWRTVYSHLGSESVSEGEEVRAGQVIGTVGRAPGNGPSLHFQVWRSVGDDTRPVDPLTVLPR